MRGGISVGRVVAAVAGLLGALAIVVYFVNPFGSPIRDPIARVLGFAIYRMPSRSMEPTLKDGAMFVVNTATLRDRDPVPGELVVFLHPLNPRGMALKRVVAVGGSAVEMHDGAFFVDGKKLSEPYVEFPPVHFRDAPSTAVPDGAFWVLGDNRANSEDSWAYGPVPRENMIGVFNGLALNN